MLRRILLAMAVAALVRGQSNMRSLAIDPQRPFVYLEFVRMGPRQPLTEGESPYGIWIRLRNNSRYSIDVDAYRVERGKTAIALCHGVVQVGSVAEGRFQGSARLRAPTGYDTTDVVSTMTVAPGEALIFSIPEEHVRPEWYVRIKFDFHLARAPKGRPPYSFTDFVWTDIPPDLQQEILARTK
jgi:hypothetical protein